TSRAYDEFCLPLRDILRSAPVLKSRGDRPLQMTFGHRLNALIRFHLQEHDSSRHLVSDLDGNTLRTTLSGVTTINYDKPSHLTCDTGRMK
ncbi:MAG: hypothetical protein D3906_08115, partial [Candidatus Electrothrix sp. AUS1_2]|nr:hypothetical protein [Candidatus Electrothrix sp. AUS1_2]